jgi:hypothetical protein
MKTLDKKVNPISNITLPVEGKETTRGSDSEPKLVVVPKKIKQGRVPVTMNGVSYPSICNAMNVHKIPQDPLWYQIRRELKNTGKSTITLGKETYNFSL